MLRLLTAIVALIRSWLTIDRIRSGQSLQQLAGIEIGETVFVEGQPAVVVKRNVIQAHEGRVLTIDCSTENGPATLRVECHPADRAPLLTWERASAPSALQLHDVVIPRRN